MNNIKFSVFENLIKARLTTKEIDLFLVLLRYQDLAGDIIGIHHREICAECNMCAQTFYDCLRALRDKQLIHLEKTMQHDYDIKIAGNSFMDKNFKNYINVNNSMFVSVDFKALTGNEKLLALDIFKQCKASGSGKVIGKEKFVEKYMKLFRVCRKTVKRYLTHIRKIFKVVLKDKLYCFYIEELEDKVKSAAVIYRERFVRMCTRRAKGYGNPDAYQDTANLVKQYQDKIENIFIALEKAICAALSTNRVLQPALVHSILTDGLGLAKKGVKPKSTEKKKKTKSKFNDYPQNQYDFEALEKELLARTW